MNRMLLSSGHQVLSKHQSAANNSKCLKQLGYIAESVHEESNYHESSVEPRDPSSERKLLRTRLDSEHLGNKERMVLLNQASCQAPPSYTLCLTAAIT